MQLRTVLPIGGGGQRDLKWPHARRLFGFGTVRFLTLRLVRFGLKTADHALGNIHGGCLRLILAGEHRLVLMVYRMSDIGGDVVGCEIMGCNLGVVPSDDLLLKRQHLVLSCGRHPDDAVHFRGKGIECHQMPHTMDQA